MGRTRSWIVGTVTAALAASALAVVVGQESASAAATQLPLTVVNNSGRGDATYVYVVARNGLTGQQGYVDAGGTWHAYSFPASVPPGQPNPPAPGIAIAGPGNGGSTRITLPPNLSGGRIYLAMGSKLSFFLTPNGLVEPAPWVASDPSHDVLYDWTEFARTGTRIFINTTAVDMFSVPLSVTVANGSGGSRTEGALTATGRPGLLAAVDAPGGDWPKLVYKRPSDGLPLRVLAPSHGIANGVFSSTYLDGYVNDVWSYYTAHPLMVTMALGTFTGRVSGSSFTFRNAGGTVVGTLPKPTTSEVFGCSGAMQPPGQPDETAILAIGARVCAGLNRATLSTAARVVSDSQPTTNAATFYGQPTSNLYSKVMHQFAASGRAYGFAYDDVADFAPTIDEADPTSVTMTIGSFGGSSGSGSTIAGPGGKCVDVAGDDTGRDGAAVQLWDCQSWAKDQHWTWTGTALTTLGLCLDIAGGGTTNGTKVQLHDCTGNPAQQWVVSGNGLRNPQSGRCLDSPGGATTNGTRLQIYDCNNTPAQAFRVG
jgi:Beta-1,3-glucanase/Ricin-type beta-trefoil lectin domain